MSFQIKPPTTFLDKNGNPAYQFQVYVGKPNLDPRLVANRLVLTDTVTGAVISNPFPVGVDGRPRNVNGNKVNPTISEEAYAIALDSPGGTEEWAYADIRSDAFGLTSGSGEMVDTTFNNFPVAQATDLSAFNLIFIQSETAAWEGTATGPVNSYYSFRTGDTGPAGTGTFDLFYDSTGKEWKIAQISEPDSTPGYLGKSFNSNATFTANSAAFQVVASDTSTNTFQGSTYDYGNSSSTIVIPTGITHGIFTYTISPSGNVLAPFVAVSGDEFNADIYKDGALTRFAVSRLYHANSVTTGGLDNLSASSGVVPVVAAESWTLRAQMNGQASAGDPPEFRYSFEFTPVFL